jgi:hypothetical protein
MSARRLACRLGLIRGRSLVSEQDDSFGQGEDGEAGAANEYARCELGANICIEGVRGKGRSQYSDAPGDKRGTDVKGVRGCGINQQRTGEERFVCQQDGYPGRGVGAHGEKDDAHQSERQRPEEQTYSAQSRGSPGDDSTAGQHEYDGSGVSEHQIRQVHRRDTSFGVRSRGDLRQSRLYPFAARSLSKPAKVHGGTLRRWKVIPEMGMGSEFTATNWRDFCRNWTRAAESTAALNSSGWT